jgi:hypothetical protein
MAALDSFIGRFQGVPSWTGTLNRTGLSALSDSAAPAATQTQYGSSYQGAAVANAALSSDGLLAGCDQCSCTLLTIAGAGSTTVDLTSLADILGRAGQAAARVKLLRVEHLSVAQDSANGGAASHVTLGNAGGNDLTSQAGGRGWFGSATSTFEVPNGGKLTFEAPTAAGVLVDGTHKLVKIANGDAANAAKVRLTVFFGSS